MTDPTEAERVAELHRQAAADYATAKAYREQQDHRDDVRPLTAESVAATIR